MIAAALLGNAVTDPACVSTQSSAPNDRVQSAHVFAAWRVLRSLCHVVVLPRDVVVLQQRFGQGHNRCEGGNIDALISPLTHPYK